MAKKLILAVMVLFALASLPFISCARASLELWSQTYGGAKFDEAYSMTQTSDGGYALAGSTNSFGAGTYEFWLVKTDSNGNIEWNQTYGGADNDRVYSLVETYDEGYALGGGPLLVKTDAQGKMEWNKTYSGLIRALVETSDEGYALAGLKHSQGSGNYDVWLVKTDKNGNIEWNQTYDKGTAHALVITPDGGFALAGGNRLIKTDSHGNLEWNQTYEKGSSRSLIVTSDGGYVLAGYEAVFSILYATYTDFWLAKTDAHGNIEWNQTYAQNDIEEANSVVETSDGGYAVAGYTASPPEIEHNFWLIKTNSEGNVQWNHTYGGEKMDEAYCLVENSDKGFALAGITWSFGNGASDFWLVKTDAQGIPEFPSYTIIPLLLIASFTAIICRQRLMKKSVNSLN